MTTSKRQCKGKIPKICDIHGLIQYRILIVGISISLICFNLVMIRNRLMSLKNSLLESRYICRVLLKTLCIQLKLNICSRLSQCNNWIGKQMPKLTKVNFEGMFGRSKEQRRRMEKLNIEVVKLEMPRYSKFIQPWTRCFGTLVMGGFQGMRQYVFS